MLDPSTSDFYLQGMSTVQVSDLLHLSLAERLQLAEDLWDSIAAEAAERPDGLPISEAHGRLVLARSEAYRRDPSSAVPLDEALDRIERSLG